MANLTTTGPGQPEATTQEKRAYQRTADLEEIDNGNSRPKPPAFYFALLSLMLGVFVVSLDATSLPVAIPVGTLRGSLPLRVSANLGQFRRSSPMLFMARH
jgi:hypothetical protein